MPPAIPAHVPRELVVDFDFMNLPGHRDDVHVAWKRAVENAPDVFWSGSNAFRTFARKLS